MPDSGLAFVHGPMSSGKSTLAIQLAYALGAVGKVADLYVASPTVTETQREASIRSRLGSILRAPEVNPSTNLADLLDPTSDHVIVDEAQFLTPAHVEDLAAHAVYAPVTCYGLLTDFTRHLFPASARLVELSDRIDVAPTPVYCWSCQRPGNINSRVDQFGQVMTDGETMAVGDVTSGKGATYRVVCASCYRGLVERNRKRVEPRPPRHRAEASA